MFSLVKAESIDYVQSSMLSACDFLIHAFCTRRGGVSRENYRSLNMSFSEGDEEYRVLQNWGLLAAEFKIPLEQFLVVNQVHGDAVFVIKPHGQYFTSRADLDYDAIVTSRTDLAISIKTADCAPVFVVDKIKKIIGAIHAGWRGSSLDISAKVVGLMQSRWGSEPRDLVAAIGPAIGRCCYEIDETTAGFFREKKNSFRFLFPGNNKNRWFLDLKEVNRRQLIDCGLSEDSIEASDYCTMCNQQLFFSHRGSGGSTGRQINFIMIRGEKPCLALSAGSQMRQ